MNWKERADIISLDVVGIIFNREAGWSKVLKEYIEKSITDLRKQDEEAMVKITNEYDEINMEEAIRNYYKQ